MRNIAIAQGQYTFLPAYKIVMLSNLSSVMLARLKLIVNVTNGVVIYKWNEAGKLATVSGNIITLVYDTTSMDSADTLMIIYDYEDIPEVKTTDELLSDIGNKLDSIISLLAEGFRINN